MGLGRWKAGGGIEEKANDLIWFWFEEFGYSPGFDAVEFIVQLFGLEGGWFQCAPPSSTRRHCWFLVSFVHIFQTVPADGALCFFWSLRDPSSQTSIWTCWPVGIPWTYLFEREIPIPLLFCLFFVFQDFWPSIQSRLLSSSSFFFFFHFGQRICLASLSHRAERMISKDTGFLSPQSHCPAHLHQPQLSSYISCACMGSRSSL